MAANLLTKRVEYLVKEWNRQADEIDEDGEAVDMSESEQQKAQTLRHCADVLVEALDQVAIIEGRDV